VLALDLCCHKKARHRVERGSKIITILTPENIIQLIERGITVDEMPYFVMKYLESLDLGTAFKINEISPISKVDTIIQLLKALSYARQKRTCPPDSPGARFLAPEKRNKSPTSARTGFLFGLLLLIFVQYLTLFDG